MNGQVPAWALARRESRKAEGVADRTQWVKLEDIFGYDTVPIEVAAYVILALKHMLRRDEVSPNAKFQFLEFLAIDYLNGLTPEEASL